MVCLRSFSSHGIILKAIYIGVTIVFCLIWNSNFPVMAQKDIKLMIGQL
jgi:hypothetical protein